MSGQTSSDLAKAKEHFKQFLAFHDQGDLDLAWNEIEKANKIDPGYAGSFGYLGQAYENRGNLAKAIAAYKEFIKYAESEQNRGRFEEFLKGHKNRIAELERIMQKNKPVISSEPEGTFLTTCNTCHKRTPVPTRDPPFGTPLRCIHCQSPLIRPSEPEEGNPISTSSELLKNVYGYSGRYLDHPRCPICGRINYSVVFPERGRFIGWYAVGEPENPQAFRITVRCVHCSKDFYVEWDTSPI